MPAEGNRSKKPSGAGSRSLPEAEEFFVERSLGGKVILEVLREAGYIVHTHADHFAPDCPDPEWLHAVGQRGWIVLTKDARIRYRPRERATLLDARVKAFILTGKGGTGADMARTFLKAIPAIRRIASETPPPFIAHVWKSGEVKVMEPKPDSAPR